MPEHFHLLVSEPQESTPSKVMQALKLGFARRVLIKKRRRCDPAEAELFARTPQHIWQKCFYDFNIWTGRKRVEKLRYIHRNPIKRRLVTSPELGTGAVTGPMPMAKQGPCWWMTGPSSR